MSWAPSNDTLGGYPSWNGTDSRDIDHEHASHHNSHKFRPDTTYLIATIYLSFLCVVAVVMCLRNRTRLRVHACFITYLGLTIAVIGLLRAKFLIGPAWFWAWNFTGESSGVVVLVLTIVSVGSGFYPLVARTRNVYWRVSMCVIVVYGIAGLATVTHYVYTKVIHHPLTGQQVQRLRDDIVARGIFSQRELMFQRRWEITHGLIPDRDTTQTGVKDWTELAWAEKEMFARPETRFYLGHQVFMLLTCMCAVLFLFIPLVRQHRNGPVGRHVDGDMMAVGVWYLSTLMTLAFAYAVLNMYYCIDNEFIYRQQAQAIDLCLRITIGPIFFLPAPGFLLRFYRERFQRMKAKNGSGRRNGGSSNQTNGSFTNSAVGNTSASREGTQVGSRVGAGDSNKTCSYDLKHDTSPKFQEPTNPIGASGRFKMFHARDRGTSMDSRRPLAKDFECESFDSHQLSEGHRNSFQVYNAGSQNSFALEYINSDKEKKVLRSFDPLQGEKPRCSTDTLKQPEPVLTEQHIQAGRNMVAYNWMGNESAANNALNTGKSEEADEQLDLITGSTVFEIDDLMTVSIRMDEDANPVQDPKQPSNTPFEHLTGLQRQLAEHRSALLPKVLAYQAYHEDLASGEPFERKHKPANPYDTSAHRQDTSEANMMGSSSRARSHADNLFEAEPKSTTHLVDPNHWSLSPASPQTWAEAEETMNCAIPSSGFNSVGSSKPREHKSKEGLIAVFSKALNSSKDKGGHSKDGGQASQLRMNHDTKDRGLKNGGNHGDSTFELNSTPIAPTVEELTLLSARERQGESSRCNTSYDYDPYDDQPGFKRFRDSVRPSVSHSNSYLQNGLDTIDGSMPDAKGSSSVAPKGGSTPSLGSSKSKDSLSKNNATSKDSHGRPTSPSKKSSSRVSSRASRSKSEGAYSEGIEIPRTPTIELPANAARLVSAAAAATASVASTVVSPTTESPAIPPSMVKTSLPPPPRQSWRRSSKHFKSIQSPIIPIDTAVFAEGEQWPVSEPLPSTMFNSASVVSSPVAITPSSQPLSPILQGLGYSNDLPRASRERERTTQLSPRGSRRQRSVDNMASTYHYKKASELTTSNNGQMPRQIRDASSSFTRPSNSGPPPSPGLKTTHGANVFAYPFGNQDPNGRGSPSPTQYINAAGNRNSSSPSVMMITNSHHPIGASYGGDFSSGDSHSRASSFTNNRILADDSWTQAMINRAQAKTSSPSTHDRDMNRDRESDRAASPVYHMYRRPSAQVTSAE